MSPPWLALPVETDTQPAGFEGEFRQLLEKAAQLPTLLGEAQQAFLRNELPGDQFPEATAARQMLVITPQYRGALLTLGDAQASLTALGLMRPLIETWTHLYFISHGPPKEAACRALRLEVGWATDLVGLVRVQHREDQLRIAERRLAELEELRRTRGCRGGSRDYGDVGATVKQMAGELDVTFLPDAWRSSSQIVHAAGWDWTVESNIDGRLSPVSPKPSQRATWLRQLVILYAQVTQTYLLVAGADLHSPTVLTLWNGCLELFDHRWLTGAINGDFD